MKKIPVWLIVIAVVALLIASKFLFFPGKNDKISGRPKGGSSTVIPVNYHIARQGAFSNRLFAAGKIGALNQVEIVPEIAGRITQINFREGATVQKGSVLLKLNDADLQAQLTKIRTQISLSEQKMKRLKKLLEVEGVSREEFEMQENELAALKADESFIRAQIAKTSITAPFTGVVGLDNISEGSYVNTSNPVVSLVQVRPLYVEFSVPEKYHEAFKKGLTISFSSSGGVSESHTASVYAIEPRVEEATKTIRARALYDGKQTFYPGSYVEVHVNLGEIENAIMVPTQCVIPTIDGQKVFIVRGDSVTEKPVSIGVRTDKAIEITRGLKPGDTIVASGLLGVKQGSKIKLVNGVN